MKQERIKQQAQSRPSAAAGLLAHHRRRPYAFLLDRAASGRRSFAGSAPRRQLVVDRRGTAHLWNGRRWRATSMDPIEAIAEFVAAGGHQRAACEHADEPGDPLPRTVGYLSYELGRFVERVPALGNDPVAAPLAVLSTYDEVDCWDPRRDRVERLRFGEPLRGDPPTPLLEAPSALYPAADDDRSGYERGFARIQAAIRGGEIYQANLSRRIVRTFTADPVLAYLHLRNHQPVPWGAYLDAGKQHILSNSPECFLLVDGDLIRTFPIKGTRPRKSGRSADRAAAEELSRNEKERAEHLMIVDLERNDLGRICRTGSVTVPQYARVESFATVHHLVSEVRGRLRPAAGLAQILRATFPGGSITGAPKIKSMEIIAEVESTARGVYTGAIGCFNGERKLALNIAIRTAIVAGGAIHYSAGGGIVADSRCDAEWDETETKALAFYRAMTDFESVASAAAR